MSASIHTDRHIQTEGLFEQECIRHEDMKEVLSSKQFTGKTLTLFVKVITYH